MRSVYVFFVLTVFFVTFLSIQEQHIYLQHLAIGLDFESGLPSHVDVKPSQRPIPLDPHLRKEPVLLVHVGKTAGSSIREMLNYAEMKCHYQRRNAVSITMPCALARVTHRQAQPSRKIKSDVVHMWSNQDTYGNYKQYLIPVRNPIDLDQLVQL